MAHGMITGMTESGKSTLAKMICTSVKKRGFKTAVLDPLNDVDWDCDFQTNDGEDFLVWCKDNKKAVLFVDESGATVGRYNTEMQWLTTQSRHWGHSCFMICQALSQVSPIIRQQCTTFYVFGTGERNLDILSDETRHDTRKFINLQKGQFIKVSRFKEIELGQIIFPKKGRVPLDKLELATKVISNDETISIDDDSSLDGDSE